ncbi:MAG: hypothetical protein QX189_09120 [Methylococcales bacterium]
MPPEKLEAGASSFDKFNFEEIKMAQETTTSTDWVYLAKYYSLFKVNFYVKNVSSNGNTAKVQFRSIYRNEIELEGFRCSNQSAIVYTEVWFKSSNGQSVTVQSGFGSC